MPLDVAPDTSALPRRDSSASVPSLLGHSSASPPLSITTSSSILDSPSATTTTTLAGESSMDAASTTLAQATAQSSHSAGVVAGRKHESTPPPLPIPPRSLRHMLPSRKGTTAAPTHVTNPSTKVMSTTDSSRANEHKGLESEVKTRRRRRRRESRASPASSSASLGPSVTPMSTSPASVLVPGSSSVGANDSAELSSQMCVDCNGMMTDVDMKYSSSEQGQEQRKDHRLGQQHTKHREKVKSRPRRRKGGLDHDADNVLEFIKDCLYFMWTCTTPANTRQITYLTIDDYLIYPPFFSDFGPFDIANVFRFCCLMKERFELARSQGKILCLYTKPEDEKRANAAFSICCYMMLLHNQTPDIAYAPLRQIHPAIRPFRDAGSGPCTYTLTILDSLRGLARGLDLGLLNLQNFDVKEYEKYEQVVHGDLNWITPFFIAFAGPKDSMTVEALRRLQRKEAMEERRKARADRERYERQQQMREGAGETNVLLEAWRRGLADGDSGDSATSGSESTLSLPGSSTMASSTSNARVSDSSSLSSQSSSSSSLSSPSASSSSSSSSDDHSRSITPFPIASLQCSVQPLSNGSNGSTLEEVEYEDHGNDYYTDTTTATTTDSSTASLTLSTGKLKQKQPHRVRTRLSKRFQSVLDYFEQHGVDCVIRLSDKTYDEKHFRIRGIHHVDLVYPDGHCPPLDIVERFLEICEQFIQPQPKAPMQQEPHEQDQGLHDAGLASARGGARKQGGIVAVHCMAGLGRTGTLIAVYLMRHYDMSAREAIAFLRLMRPGSVVGPQQNWLDMNEWWIRQSGNQQHRRHRATARVQVDYEQVFSGAILGGLYVDGSCLETDVSDVENSVVSGLGLGVDHTRDSMALAAIPKTQEDTATSSSITDEYADGLVSHNDHRLGSSSLTPTLASVAAGRGSGLSDRQSRIQTKSLLPVSMTEPLSDTSTTTDEDSEDDIEETMAATQTLMVAEQEHIDNKAYVIPVQPRKSIHSAHHPRSPRYVGESLERASLPVPEQSQRITTPLLSNATMAMTSTGAKVSDGRTWSPRTLTSGSHHDRVPWAIRAAGLPIASLHSYHAIRNNTDNNNSYYNNSSLEKISDRHGAWGDKANYRNDNFGSSKSSHADNDDHVYNDTGNKNKVGYNGTQTLISRLPRKRAGVVLEDPSSPPSLNSDDNADDLSTTTASSSSSFSRQGRLQHAIQHPRKRRGHRDEMGL